jgi:hypothetical protein
MTATAPNKVMGGIRLRFTSPSPECLAAPPPNVWLNES